MVYYSFKKMGYNYDQNDYETNPYITLIYRKKPQKIVI
jgi:hypothetical protein